MLSTGKGILIVITIFLLLGLKSAATENLRDDKREMERLGLTQQEWKLYKKWGMSKRKLRRILASGITVKEYFEGPWFELGISDEEWISMRRKGLKNEEIKLSLKKGGKIENGMVAASCLLPGSGHFRLRQKVRGFFLSGGAIASLALFAVDRKSHFTQQGKEERLVYEYLGLYGIVCLLSSLDILRQTRSYENPDMERFTLFLDPVQPQTGVILLF